MQCNKLDMCVTKNYTNRYFFIILFATHKLSKYFKTTKKNWNGNM